jgi:integrase/recombinase XerD
MKEHKNTAYTELIDGFITFKRIQGYKYVTEQDTLRMFENFLTQYPTEEICIKKDMMDKWCHARPYESRKTLGNRISVVRQFAIYMVSKGYYCHIPSTLPHAGRSDFIPYIFSDDEMDRIFHVLDNLPPNRRYNSDTSYPILFRVLYGCGLRIGEALSLLIADVDTAKGILTIRHGKFNKSRLVPMSKSLTSIFYEYQCTYLLGADENSSFFQNKDGCARNRASVGHFFREILWQSKIPYRGKGKGPRLHDLRHGDCCRAIKQMSDNGIDLYCALPILSTYIGHASIRATERYLRLTAAVYPELEEKMSHLTESIYPEVHYSEAD